MPGWGRRSSWPESTTTSRSGTALRGARTWTRLKGVLRMLPSALKPNATDHVPVLADEVRQLLAIEPGEAVVDAAFGAGGHAALLAADLRGEGRLIAIDRDPTARAYFDRFRKQTGVQGRFLRGDFAVVLEQLADNGVRADAILMDLGVSSMQIDRPERGFSYAVDAPLDMRMDPSADDSARDLVNEASERDLTRIFRQYGEERFAKRSSPYWRKIRVKSRSDASLTRSRAESSADGSMRMSSGASTAYENPRSGRSICIDETPRSIRIASARTPLSASCSRTTAKSP